MRRSTGPLTSNITRLFNKSTHRQHGEHRLKHHAKRTHDCKLPSVHAVRYRNFYTQAPHAPVQTHDHLCPNPDNTIQSPQLDLPGRFSSPLEHVCHCRSCWSLSSHSTRSRRDTQLRQWTPLELQVTKDLHNKQHKELQEYKHINLAITYRFQSMLATTTSNHTTYYAAGGQLDDLKLPSNTSTTYLVTVTRGEPKSTAIKWSNTETHDKASNFLRSISRMESTF